MKKTAFVLTILATLASCGGSTQQECTDCPTDSTSVVDSAAIVDSTATVDTVQAAN